MAAPITDADIPHYHGHRQRLRQRFRDGGALALADYELLELLLFLSIPQRDVKPLAKSLIARFGGFSAVLAADPTALAAIDGVKDNTVTMLKLVEASGRRLAREEVIERPILGSW